MHYAEADPEVRKEAYLDCAFMLRADVHDAWRSTVLPPDYTSGVADEDPSLGPHSFFASNDIWNSADTGLSRATTQVVLHAVTRTIQAGEGVGVEGVYDVMKRLYIHYQLFRAREQLPVERRESITMLLASLGEAGPYGDKPPEYKEIDRRIVMVGFASLANQLHRAAYWNSICNPDVALEAPGISEAAADGQAILAYVRDGSPYDHRQGFAHEAIAFTF